MINLFGGNIISKGKQLKTVYVFHAIFKWLSTFRKKKKGLSIKNTFSKYKLNAISNSKMRLDYHYDPGILH